MKSWQSICALALIAVPLAVEIHHATTVHHAAMAARVEQVDLGDWYEDGTPNFLRLRSAQDRDAFREWFTLLAEFQVVQQSRHRLPDEITDCSSLLRYAYREALRRHDINWVHDRGVDGLVLPPSVAAYQFPNTPSASNLFRTRSGGFTPADLTDGTYAEFADAEALRLFNTHLVGRGLEQARPGDLIFFRQLEQHSPFHSMLYVGASRIDTHEREPLLVYHTGPDGKRPGEVRRVLVTELMRHPDARWRPVPGNPNFLGVYRWNILRENE